MTLILSMKKLLLAISSILIIPLVAMYTYYINAPAKLVVDNPLTPTAVTAKVLGVSDAQEPLFFTVSIPATFKEDISAPNVIYSLTAGQGINTTQGQDPIISNTGVLSLQDQTGALEFEAGGGISIDSLKISNSGVTSFQSKTGALSLTAGTGITIDGLTLTNSDLGSDQNIFQTLSVTGQTDIVVDTNSDTLTLVGSGGITITTDATTDQITISSTSVDLTQSGWSTGTNTIYQTTLTDSVGIGTTNPSVALDVVGAITASGIITGDTLTDGTFSITGGAGIGFTSLVIDNLTLDAASIISDTGAISFGDENLTTTGALTANNIITTTVGSNLIPTDNITYDLGSSEKYWKDLYLSGNTVYFDDTTDAALGFDATNDKFTFSIDDTQQAELNSSGDLSLAGDLSVTGALSTDSISLSTLSSGDSDSYDFIQTDWSGGVGALATHTDNRTEWDKYESLEDLTVSTEATIDMAESYAQDTSINFTTEGSYTQEDASNGTDFRNGIAKLHNTGYVFSDRIVIDGDFDEVRDVFAIDVDGDSDIDVLGAAYSANDITWWENDGSENFTKHTIDGDIGTAKSVFAIDIDIDGDIDVVCGVNNGYEFTWYENDGSENFTKHSMGNAYNDSNFIYAIDVDDDSDVDVLGAGYNNNDITWWENDGSENFTGHTIENATFSRGRSIFAIDLDSDTDIDMLAAASVDDDIAWFQGTPGAYASDPYYVTTTDTTQIDVSAYEHIHSVDLTQTTPTGTTVNYLVSFDDRASWMYFNTGTGVWTSSSLANLQTEGMEKTALEAITRAQWEATGGFDSSSTTVLDFAFDLYTTDTDVTPELDLITINYQYPATISETLTFSVFDTESTITQLGFLSWTETISAGTSDVKFQIRTSADNSTWTSWYGPGCATDTYYSDKTGGDTICTTNTDRINDRYFQIKVWLTTTDSSVNPTLSDVTLSYVQLSPLIINNQYSQPTFIGSGNPYYSFGAGDLFVSSDLEIGSGVVYSGVTDSASAVSFTLSTYNALTTSGAKLLSIENAETEKFAVDKDGNITVVGTVDGIDVSAIPTTYLALTGDTMTGHLVLNDSVSLKLGTSSDFTIAHGGVNTVFDNTFVTGNTQFQLGTDTTATAFQILNDTGLEIFEVDGGGNVGIGTTNPSSKLHVSGAVTGSALFTLNETGDQALLTASASGVTKLSILHNGLVNATVGGLATYTKAGTIDDTDFTDTAVDGLMGFDSANGRLYIRNAGAWSFIAKTAGFQIPAYEAEGLSAGDFLIPYVEKKMEDGAFHGLYRKFSDIKGLLFAEENEQIASISSQLATIQPVDSSIIANINDSTNQNTSLITIIQTALTELTDKISSLFTQISDIVARLTKLEDQALVGLAGSAIIPTNGSDVSIIFDPAFEETPTITVTIDNPDVTFGVKDKSQTGFTIYLSPPIDQELLFSWIAVATGSANVTVGITPPPSPTPTLSPAPTPSLDLSPTATGSSTTTP